jgi:hypothetical protein
VADNPSGQLPAGTGIGTLRSWVTLYRRDQAPADDLALQEALVPIARVHADVQPAYFSTFWESTQIEAPVTHVINIRWQNYPSTVDVVVRSTMLPDGTQSTELFRVRRSKAIAGRKRFIQMECELEHARMTPDDSDSTRNAMLTEPYSTAATTWDDGGTTWGAPSPNDVPWDLGLPP